MLSRVCLGLLLLAATPVWCQLGVIPYQTSTGGGDEERMQTPPPVSGGAYPTMVGSEVRSNFMAVGLTLSPAYVDNIAVDGSITSGSDVAYSILPTISLNQNTPRQQLMLTYSPGFTIYQRTSVLNAANQTAVLNFEYHLSKYTTISVQDSFQKSSNLINQLYPLGGMGISGSTQSSSAQVIEPNANQLSNTTTAVLCYQFSRNGMIGAGGIFTKSSYSNPADASDLTDSTSRGGSIFYSRRLFGTQYTGVIYQYVRSQDDPVTTQSNSENVQTKVKAQTFLAFYTLYLTPTISLSLSGGPQYSNAVQSPSPPVLSWTPSVMASIGWQRGRTNLAASYSRTVTGASGLSGVFNSYQANTHARWRITRTWTGDLWAYYLRNESATPLLFSSSSGGHTVWGRASLQHSFSERLNVELRYTRLHQTYDNIAAISASPDNNSAAISISYQLSRALGR